MEIRIYIDSIQIINYPGPAKWIDMEKFAAGKVRARKYRNRRIGEFFKEMELSEKQSTGIPTILKELRNNGFLSNNPEAEKLVTEEYQQQVADCHMCRSICRQNRIIIHDGFR